MKNFGIASAKYWLIALALLCVATIANAAAPGSFYLLSGPEFTGTPAHFSGAFTGDLGRPIGLSAVLAQGEGFDGNWATVVKGKRRFGDPPTPPEPQLAAAWDAVYGRGFFTAQVLGAPFFESAVLKGTKGSTLHVEIYRASLPSEERRDGAPLNLLGIAQDEKGNLYKVVF